MGQLKYRCIHNSFTALDTAKEGGIGKKSDNIHADRCDATRLARLLNVLLLAKVIEHAFLKQQPTSVCVVCNDKEQDWSGCLSLSKDGTL